MQSKWKHIFGCTQRLATLVRVGYGCVRWTKNACVDNFSHAPASRPFSDVHQFCRVWMQHGDQSIMPNFSSNGLRVSEPQVPQNCTSIDLKYCHIVITLKLQYRTISGLLLQGTAGKRACVISLLAMFTQTFINLVTYWNSAAVMWCAVWF